jgi:hypothetical protein
MAPSTADNSVDGRVIARWVACSVALLVGSLAVAVSVTAQWVDAVVLDTPTFVTAVEPLLADPGVHERISLRASDAINSRLDIAGNLPEWLPGFATGLLTDADEKLEAYVAQQVEAVVDSGAFRALVVESLSLWHTHLVSAIVAQPGEAPTVENTRVRVALGAYLDVFAAQTNDPIVSGVLSRIPASIRKTEILMMDVGPLAEKLGALRALYQVRGIAPLIAALAFVLGIAIAPRRREALVGAGGAVALAAGLPAVWLSQQRTDLVASMTGGLGATEKTASAVFDTLAAPLNTWLMYTAAAGAAVALVGIVLVFVSGRSPETAALGSAMDGNDDTIEMAAVPTEPEQTEAP